MYFLNKYAFKGGYKGVPSHGKWIRLIDLSIYLFI